MNQLDEVFTAHSLAIVVHHRFAEQLKALLLLPAILDVSCVFAEHVKLDKLQSIIIFLLDKLELQIWFFIVALIVRRIELRVELKNPFKPLVFRVFVINHCVYSDVDKGLQGYTELYALSKSS